MLQSVTGPVFGVLATMVVPVLTPAPSPPVAAVPVLTSAPFGAPPGHRVTHTITVTGTGAATRVTFTTTVDLDGIAAKTSRGSCAVAARTVVCELGDLPAAAGSAAPTITITGTVHPDASAGAVVRNRVSVASGGSATSRADQVVSNAYLLPVSHNGPTDRAVEGSSAVVAAPQRASRSTLRGPAVAALLAGGAVALGSLLLVWRQRRRRASPPPAAQRL